MITQNYDYQPGNRYSVRVGFAMVTVEGASRAEIIQAARRQLCLEMPRMWDVIQSLGEERFQVKDA